MRPSYGTTTPRYLKLVIIRNISHFALISLRDSLTLFIIGLVILALISFPYFVFVSSGLSSSISSSCSSSAKISSLSANWRLVKVLQPVLPFQASRNIKVKGHKLGTVTSFKYLGAVVSDDGSKPEVLSRITQATAALTKLKPIWRDNNISLGSNVIIHVISFPGL